MEKVPKVVIFQPPQAGGELPVCDDAFFQWKKYGCNICDYRTAKRNHANRHVLKHNKRLGTVINSDSQIGSAAAAAAQPKQNYFHNETTYFLSHPFMFPPAFNSSKKTNCHKERVFL